jgi:hypothetical protein
MVVAAGIGVEAWRTAANVRFDVSTDNAQIRKDLDVHAARQGEKIINIERGMARIEGKLDRIENILRITGPREIGEDSVKDRFGVTITGRLRHAALYAVAKDMGGIQALSRHLDIPYTTVWRWCNLSECPPVTVDLEKRPSWTSERIKTLELQLYALTGQRLDQLFPQALRSNKEFLNQSKTIQQTTAMFVGVIEDE